MKIIQTEEEEIPLSRIKKFYNKNEKQIFIVVFLLVIVFLFLLTFVWPEKAHAETEIGKVKFALEQKPLRLEELKPFPKPAPPPVVANSENLVANSDYEETTKVVNQPVVESNWDANVAIGHQLCVQTFGEEHWPALLELWNHESNWSSTVMNHQCSGAAGIAQNINGWSEEYPYGDAYKQIVWGLGYILSEYGNPTNAYQNWLVNNSY